MLTSVHSGMCMFFSMPSSLKSVFSDSSFLSRFFASLLCPKIFQFILSALVMFDSRAEITKIIFYKFCKNW